MVSQLAIDFAAPAREATAAAGPRLGANARTAWALAVAPATYDGATARREWLASLPALPWRIGFTQPGARLGDDDKVVVTKRCLATVLQTDTREWGPMGRGIVTVGDLLYRGACLGCDWEGPATNHENTAAEEAVEHAWPGWRDLPIVERPPAPDSPAARRRAEKAFEAITEVCEAVMPGWDAAKGPIRSLRGRCATRHHWAPEFGWWDMGVPADQGEAA